MDTFQQPGDPVDSMGREPATQRNQEESPAELLRQTEQALSRGVAYLKQHQYPNGEFCVYCANDLPIQQGCAPDSSVFPTALIAGSLLFLADQPGVDEMLTRSTRFLLSQKTRGGLWSHFTTRHQLRHLCGPDSDDTAVVSAVLKARGISEPLSKNVRLLLANRNAEGLFYTWFVTRFCRSLDPRYWRIVLSEWKQPLRVWKYWRGGEARRDGVDAVVNANVLYYLGEIPETGRVIDYLLRILADGQESRCDFWYHEPNIIYYFFSRNYYRGIKRLEPARQPMLERIRASAREDGRLGETVLETAMGLCALLNLGAPPRELTSAARFLLEAQQPTGEWPRWLMYFGGPRKGLGWGSEELTTGYCLEALARFLKAQKSPSDS